VPKVLTIINRLNLGGPAFHVAILTKHLQKEFEVKLLAGTKQDSEESSDYIIREMGLTFTPLREMKRSLHPWRDFKSYREIRKIIREYKPDIVHTHAAKAGALGRLAAYHERVPVIIHTFHGHVFHSYFHPLKTKVFLKIERYLSRLSSAIVAISDRQKRELTLHYRVCEPAQVHVIPLGFDLSRFQEDTARKRREFRERFLLEEDEIAVGIIGRVVPVKNHSLFISSAAHVLGKTSKRVRFFIIGDGESRGAVMQEARRLGIEYCYFPDEKKRTALTFCGWVKNIDKCIAGLDIVALCSFNEGTPVSLIEAQAGGRAVISTNVGGIENVVRPGETALLVSGHNFNDFSDALLRLIEDDALRKRLSDNGWEFVKEKFHYTRLIREMSTLYNMLLVKAREKNFRNRTSG
jgi:glycosyltransferase involved in cell wall biosynthesis